MKMTESKEIQFRFEAFNLFNHAQFTSPNGLINSLPPSQGGTFGLVTSARAARIMQAGLKFLF